MTSSSSYSNYCNGRSGKNDEPKSEQENDPTILMGSSSASTDRIHSSSSSSSSVIIFSAPLVQKLNEARLPPNYVGVRRIRPSSLGVKAKLLEGQQQTQQQQQQQFQSQVVFRVATADGQERRMTRQEKKQLKYQIAMEKKKEKKRKHHESLQANNTVDDDNDDDNEDDNDDDDKNGKHDTNNNNGDKVKGNEETTLPNFLLNKQQIFDNNNNNKSNIKNKYHQLGLNPVALEQEIADLRGERGAVPPVFLSPAMAVQAQGILPESSSSSSSSLLSSWMSPSSDESKKSKCCSVTYDHELSIQWAKELKESMIPAETTRRSEDMRPMAYQLMPEPWSRMRPDWQNTTSSSSSSNEAATVSDTRIHDQIFFSKPANVNIKQNTQKEAKEEPYVITTKPCEWAAGVCRPPVDYDDVDMALVFEYLHQQPNFHVSCGSKFGSDFLVYDGPRDERHAFAGMRVLVPSREKDSGTSATKNTTTNNNNNNNNASRLPLPTAYSMAGYVRCLNTAGKLAILATVVRDTAATDDADDDYSGTTTMYRIAFVDVALEKILSAPTHQKRFKTNKRRDVGKNLAKK